MNAAEVYRKTVSKEAAWARKHRGKFSVFLSSSTDPWQPLEQKYRITRQVLRALQSHPPDRLILQTHSHRMAEDWEDIESLARRCDLRVHVSIEGDRDRLPGLPPPPCSLKDRLELIRQSVARGFFTVACLSPLYPLTDPEAFFARLAETGLRAVILDHFIEGDGTPDGSRTQKTGLPEAMARVEPESVHLSYRDAMVRIARTYLPVGISASGFAGHYHSKR
ncbi:MAG: hypothetical protein GWM98_23450 [Nitrospinaceae bacterium]|nr:hypothetical protein [Nitrospinaceae bacterium]NIR56869.1 hypothetical protein [Nitrospinaceae bacterium]NIS87335.1 hypothetical protein [Nitrospinaceae bacterium]NIT84191.1 hypothetical protein [Nitrospinaceae bacterium]NIU46375.1 hypothetical protein [Nitrospinaceae bacterium]